MMKDKVIQDSVKAGNKFGYMDKVKALADLPENKVLVAYIKEAMVLNESGVKMARAKYDKPKVLEVPDYFEKALSVNKAAKEVFYGKSDSFRNVYIVWITDAKTEDTRQKRIDQSLEWIAEGKGRFWQYAK